MPVYTTEEFNMAKRVDLISVAAEIGYTVKPKGSYHYVEEMDSVIIYDRKSWYRWSGGYGGSQIDFLCSFCNMGITEAVGWLLDFAGYSKGEGIKNKKSIINEPSEFKKFIPFVLPEPAINNVYLYKYLSDKRKISKKVIDYFVSNGLIYESGQYHNVVFKGMDKDGDVRFASMRGTYDDKDGNGFKCDVRGNDKRYGFNVRNPESKTVAVFEAAIDLMSYVDMHQDYSINMVALGMLHDGPLATFLKENPQIETIFLCLDHDEPGLKAVSKINGKYKGSYDVRVHLPSDGYKDYNKWLGGIKGGLVSVKERDGIGMVEKKRQIR